jgi:anti-sigma factor RsiW
MRCWFFRRDLTALVDRELSPARAAAVQAHLTGCAACAALHEDIAASVTVQSQLIPLAFGPTDVASGAMLQRLRERLPVEGLAEMPEVESPVRRWFFQPAAMGTIAVATVIVATMLGVLDPVFISVGFENPPEVVAEQPELFRDYVIFENLDALQHFDDVNSIQLSRAVADQPQG